MELRYPNPDMLEKIANACPVPNRPEDLWLDLSDLAMQTNGIQAYLTARLNYDKAANITYTDDLYVKEYISIVTEMAMLKNTLSRIFTQLPLPDEYTEEQVISDVVDKCIETMPSTNMSYRECLSAKPPLIDDCDWSAVVGKRFIGVQPWINAATGLKLRDVLEAGRDSMSELMYDVEIGFKHYKDTGANLIATFINSVKESEYLNRTVATSFFDGTTVKLRIKKE